MAATWKTKWGVRRVRRDTPTIEEALIAAESLANDPGQRAEIAASLMGVPVDEVRVLAAKQAAKTRGRASLVAASTLTSSTGTPMREAAISARWPGEPGCRAHARGRGRVQASSHGPRTDLVRSQALRGARPRLAPHRLARLAAEGRVVRYWLRAATSVERTATAIRVEVVISTKSTLRKASASTAEKAAAI
jgi:hypothetical protein